MDKSREDMKAALKLLPDKTRPNNAFGIIDWEIGATGDAEDNFSFEASNGPNKRYAWLWYTLTELRLGKSVPRRELPDFDHKAWPAPIINFFLGDATREDVMTAAQQGSPDDVKGQVCEANFYIGEWLLQHHDQPGAKPLMTKAAADCPTGFIEWTPAQMDLAGLQ
jgi:lipoprotein NlpI